MNGPYCNKEPWVLPFFYLLWVSSDFFPHHKKPFSMNYIYRLFVLSNNQRPYQRRLNRAFCVLQTYFRIRLALKKTGFSPEKNSSQKNKYIFYLFSMQLFSADATMFSKYMNFFFDRKKLKKPPSKVAQKNSNPLFYPCCPELPKWPKQKN